MFFGNNQLTIDAKGRIAVPTRHREPLTKSYGPALIITPDAFEHSIVNGGPVIHCLKMYPLKVWQSIGNTALRKNAAPYRYMLEHAQESEMDAQGRVLLQPTLRNQVHYGKHLMMVGMIDYFALWREDCWHEHNKQLLQGTREMSDSEREGLKDGLAFSAAADQSRGESRLV